MPQSTDLHQNSNTGHAGRQDIAPARALELLNELRDRLADGVAGAYAQNLKQARQDMTQLAARATEPARQDLYNSGYALLTNGGMGLLRRFRDLYNSECDQAIARLSGKGVDAWDSAGELSLVDSSEFERDLAIGRLSAKATYACSQQLTALDRRVAVLLDIKRMESDSNPFTIKRLFTAFVKAAEANWAGEQLSLILLETFEHYTADELLKIYRGLNEFLVQEGVLEKLPVEIEEREHELARRQRGGDLDGDIGDVFVQLTSGLMSHGRGGRPARGGGGYGGAGLGGSSGAGGFPPIPPISPAVAGGGGPAAGSDPLRAAGGEMGPMVLGQFLDGLTGLQRGSGQAAAKLGVALDEFDPTSSAMLRSLASSPLLRWLQPNDAMTIELIAMLFDCIFTDSDVPDALRAELGRLQVPVLKVALMNKGFFSDPRHPARRLMDLIANAVRGWSADGEAELLSAVRGAVNSVLEGFENDTGVFTAQIEKLEKMLKQADQRARENVSDLVRRLEQRDRKTVAETLVRDQIARRVDGQPLPEPVKGFIDHVWRELLTRIYIKQGDKGEIWQQALEALDDLIWSIQPKTDPAQRNRLMAMLPTLLHRLPEGMALIGREDAWDPFLQQLMKLHMEAIKPKVPEAAGAQDTTATRPMQHGAAGRGAAGGPAQTGAGQPGAELEPGSALAEGLAGAQGAAGTGVSAAQPSAGEAPQQAPAPSAAEAAGEARTDHAAPMDDRERAADEFLEAARRIELGDWVEFSGIGASDVTLRASWMSRLSGLILFADRQGRNAEILTTDRVAKLLRNGNARVLSRDPLTDRAVAKLLVTAAPGEAAPA